MAYKGVPQALRSKILERDGYCCIKCGSVEKLEIHHIIPRSLGGGYEPDNLVTLCQICHKYSPDHEVIREKLRPSLYSNADILMIALLLVAFVVFILLYVLPKYVKMNTEHHG